MNRVTPEQPVTMQYAQLLLDLKSRQQAGEHMACPRCGKDTMKPDFHTNALSRHADLFICDQCGTAEAMLDFMNNCFPSCVRGLRCFLWKQGLAQYGCIPAHHMALKWKIHRGEEMLNAICHAG